LVSFKIGVEGEGDLVGRAVKLLRFGRVKVGVEGTILGMAFVTSRGEGSVGVPKTSGKSGLSSRAGRRSRTSEISAIMPLSVGEG